MPVVPRPSYHSFEIATGVVYSFGQGDPEAFAVWLKQASPATVVALATVVVSDIRARSDYLGTPFSEALSNWCVRAARVANGR
jgi:hypothetical protein